MKYARTLMCIGICLVLLLNLKRLPQSAGSYVGKPYDFEEIDASNQTEVHVEWRGPGRYFISMQRYYLDSSAYGISGVREAKYTEWDNPLHTPGVSGVAPYNYGWWIDLEAPTCVQLHHTTLEGPEPYFTIYIGESSYSPTTIIKQPGCHTLWELADIPDAVLRLVTSNFPAGFSYTTAVKYGAVLFIADDDPQDIAVLWDSDTNVYNGTLWCGEYRALHGTAIEYNPNTDTAIWYKT